MLNDPYAALDLPKSATAAEIKKAYRKKVRTSHPDLHPTDPDAEARFKALTAAYDVLKDPETRARYDADEIDGLGAERPPRQFYRDFAGSSENIYQQSPRFGQNSGPADIFAEILRNRAGPAGDGKFGNRSSPIHGADSRYSLRIPFLDAVRGSETRIDLPDGQELAVKIPLGTEDGQTLRLRGKGAPGFNGGPNGDALITILLKPHPVFRRKGSDIVLTLPITIDEAVLGGKVSTPTIDGPVDLTIPPGANSGQVLRLRGRGIQQAGKEARGDQRVELKIVVPPDADSSLGDFLSEWRKSHPFDPRTDLLKGAGA